MTEIIQRVNVQQCYYLAVTVAAVAVVVTSGAMKNTSLLEVLDTLAEYDVGAVVPRFTVTLPLPRLGAVSRERLLLLTLASNL